MARMSREELGEIVDRELPGYTLAPEPREEDAPPARVTADADTPEIEVLRQKYLGQGADPGAPPRQHNPRAGDEDDEPDTEIVVLHPKGARDTWDSGPGPKVVVVSHAEKKIIGYQG